MSLVSGFPWLSARLAEQGADVAVPELPTPTEPDSDRWVATAATAIGVPAAATAIAAHTKTVSVVASDNDTIVPLELSRQVASSLGVAVQIVPGSGHFLADDGVTALPLVLDLAGRQEGTSS